MAFSPMMQHYLNTKEKYSDCILMYRLGDFYEMFFDDAVKASKILDLVLTGRDCGQSEKAPMCGVPFHAVDNYIVKLINAGCKVAICEQLTLPEESKGLVERDVVRVITPGTLIDDAMLSEKVNNYLASVFVFDNSVGVAWADISTGELCVVDYSSVNCLQQLQEKLLSISPKEVICNLDAISLNENLACFKAGLLPKMSQYYEWAYSSKNASEKILKQFNVNSLKVFDIADNASAIASVGGLLEYLSDTQKRSLTHFTKINYISDKNYMSLDINTKRNLELTLSSRERKKRGSLLWLVDNTCTSMGGRLLCKWVDQPLQNAVEINDRLDAVGELVDNFLLRESLVEVLSTFNDIERISAKIAYNNFTPRDCNALRASFEKIPSIKTMLNTVNCKELKKINNSIEDMNFVASLLAKAIDEKATIVDKDGGYINIGYNEELDKLKNVASNSRGYLADLEMREREDTSIKSLKISYNRVFGYYIEVSNSFKDQVPIRYIRKQTLTNGERFITEELKNLEEQVLYSQEKSIKLEKELFDELRNILIKFIPNMQKIAFAISQLDCLLSFSLATIKNNYVRPQINTKGTTLSIQNGRHPIIETFLKNENYISNDTNLNTTDNRVMVITGPNMAGKSTYMRQVALIVLMAHIGCFVSAENALIPIVDKIFTRVGASDDLTSNQSTFMVEMTEVAYILNNATVNSLIVLDEVGRGTSTFDGLSIAWSVLEFIAQEIKAKTLFATHFHELTELEGMIEGVKNFKLSVKELNNSIVFLRKIVRGGANKSFGVEVASLAGVPKSVIDRSKNILKRLEEQDININLSSLNKSMSKPGAAPLSEIERIVKDIDMENVTPLQAFNILSDLTERSRGKIG